MEDQETESTVKVSESNLSFNGLEDDLPILKRGRHRAKTISPPSQSPDDPHSDFEKNHIQDNEGSFEPQQERPTLSKKPKKKKLQEQTSFTGEYNDQLHNIDQEKTTALEKQSQTDDSRRKKRRKPDLTETEAAEVVRNMLQRMREAANEDTQARATGQPPIAKLKLLGEACAEIAKPKWVNWYLREGVCEELARWLTILPGGILPNMTIRSRILQLLHKIPLSIEVMSGTQLGKRLIQLWKSPDELDENRILIRSLVQLLIRLMLNFNTPRNNSDMGYGLSHGSFGSHRADFSSIGDLGLRNDVDGYPVASQGFARLSKHQGSLNFPRSSLDLSTFSDSQPSQRENNSTMARLNRIISNRKFGSSKHSKRTSVNILGKEKNMF